MGRNDVMTLKNPALPADYGRWIQSVKDRVRAAQFHGYNGVITIEGCRDLDSPWSPATSDDHFFRAILKP